MAREISAFTVPSILQPRGYTILERENKDVLQADTPCNDMVLHYLRPCHQKGLIKQHESTALRTRKPSSVGEGRIFWNAVADLISSSSFFPITINVPDMLSAMGQFITQLPIINRIYLYLTQESTPRKKKKKKKKPLLQGQTQGQTQGQHHPAHSSSTSKRRPTRRRRVNSRRDRQ